MRSFIRTTLGLCVLSILPLSAIAQQQVKAPKIVLFEHKQIGWRTSVTFSPDGKTLATGSEDNHIRFWDMATRTERLSIHAHKAPCGVSRLAYFPDGRMIASAGWAGDGTVKLWEVATGGQRQTIGKNDGGIAVLAVSPNGKLLAWGDGGTIRIHDRKTDKVVKSLSVRRAIESAVFSPDSKFLATSNWTVNIWDVSTGKLVRAISAGASTATGSDGVAYSPDGKILATASGKTRLWNVANGEEIAALGVADETAFCVAISPDGRFLASGTTHGALRLWDMATKKQMYSWNEPAYSVAFSPDSKWLAFGQSGPRSGVSLVDISVLGK